MLGIISLSNMLMMAALLLEQFSSRCKPCSCWLLVLGVSLTEQSRMLHSLHSNPYLISNCTMLLEKAIQKAKEPIPKPISPLISVIVND